MDCEKRRRRLMKRFSLFYIFPCPLGDNSCKIGLTTNARIRLEVYGMSYSNRKHTASFDSIYYGSPTAIINLEAAVKTHFYDYIEPSGGRTEWVLDHSLSTVDQQVQNIINGHRFKIKKLPQHLLPLTLHNLNEAIDFIQKTPN